MVDEGLKRIKDIPGMSARLARGLGLTTGAIAQWKRVPAERLPEVEKITGIPRHELRSDICPPPARETEAA
jgi:DNA-binding transcriptional regulator YdaS (Cro superfamily)